MSWLTDWIPLCTGIAALGGMVITFLKVRNDHRDGVRSTSAAREQAFNARVDRRLEEAEAELERLRDDLDEERRQRVAAERFNALLIHLMIRNGMEVPDRPN